MAENTVIKPNNEVIKSSDTSIFLDVVDTGSWLKSQYSADGFDWYLNITKKGGLIKWAAIPESKVPPEIKLLDLVTQ